MKIAYIADAICIHGYRWIDYFSKNHDVILICIKSQKEDNLYKNHPRVKIYPILPPVFPLKNIFIKSKIGREINGILKENNSTILHSMYAVPYAFWGNLSNSKNHIISTRGSDVFVNYKGYVNTSKKSIVSFLLKKLFEKAFNNARYIVFDSYTQKDTVLPFVKDKEKTGVIRMGVNLDPFINHHLKPKTKNEIVIFSNRAMTALYNIDKIVSAFKIIKDNHPHLSLKLITIDYARHENYLNKIKKLIVDLKLTEHVELLNEVTVAELVTLYFNSDFVIMIPSSDGSAVSGAEAMLMKKPLIIGPVAYDKDLYNSETVWQLHDIKPQTIAKTITELLYLPKEEITSKTAKAFAGACLNADFDKEVSKLEKLYKSLHGKI